MVASSKLPGCVLLLVSVSFAGCVSNDKEVTPSELGDGIPPQIVGNPGVVHGVEGAAASLLDLPAASGLQRSIGKNAFEPTLGVDPKGNVYMQAFYRGPNRINSPTVVKSADKGATWDVVGPKLPSGDGAPAHTNDPYVHVDDTTGRVFMLDLQGTVCSTLYWSDDAGKTWQLNPAACGTPGGNDHQTLTTAKPRKSTTTGYPNVVYYCVNRVADSACATSLDGGKTFGPLLTVFLGADPTDPELVCGGLHGHVTAAPDGRVYLVRSYCGPVKIAESEDDGKTWRIATVSKDNHIDSFADPAAAVDEAGNVYVFWTSQKKGLPFLSISRDQGKTWSKPLMVGPPGVNATSHPSIAAGAEGRVAFTYIGTTAPGGYVTLSNPVVALLNPNQVAADASWNAYVGLITDALSETPTVVTVTANDPADPVARKNCGRERCGDMGDFLDIVIDPEGRPWAAHVDMCTEECRNDTKAPRDFVGVGFVGTLNTGPALRGPLQALPVLVAAPEPKLA